MSVARELVHLLEELERTGTTVMDLVGAGRHPRAWALYPNEEGVFDRATGNQFYFHAHEDTPHEAGHFHTVRFSPTRTLHLVAISMAENGWPQALFTVNLWVIGDAHGARDRLQQYVREFHIDERRGDPRLVRFVNLMFTAFRPEIEALQEEKARAIAVHRLTHPDVDPFEDRSLEVLSRIAIGLRDDALSRRHT
jgi:hypothetical protein